MEDIKSILVLTDFSEIAAGSYRYALRLAGELSASIHLLHCLPSATATPGHGHTVIDLTPVLYRGAETRLRAFMERGLTGQHPAPRVDGSVSTFGLREEIDRYTRDSAVDLIVVGTHGVVDGWDRIFGTNAAYLVGKVTPPLLVLPAGVRFRPLRTICFATDLSEGDLVGGRHLIGVLRNFSPHVNFLHVKTPAGHRGGDLDRFRSLFRMKREGARARFTTVTDSDVTHGIFTYLDDHPHDLLVMMKPRRGWWDRWFGHSETVESAGVTNLPLLIIGRRF